MRLWHKDLIKVLPRKQLLSQWRELCAISSTIAKNGTPNHMLVNKVLDYSWINFQVYANLIIQEMQKRNYKISKKSYTNFCVSSSEARKYFNNRPDNCCIAKLDDLYKGWHNERYYKQCFYNLQEKFDCGGISENEWQEILQNFEKHLKEEK